MLHISVCNIKETKTADNVLCVLFPNSKDENNTIGDRSITAKTLTGNHMETMEENAEKVQLFAKARSKSQ